MPSEKEINELIFNIDILNNNVSEVMRIKPNYSAYIASIVLQEINAIMAELNLH